MYDLATRSCLKKITPQISLLTCNLDIHVMDVCVLQVRTIPTITQQLATYLGVVPFPCHPHSNQMSLAELLGSH